MNRTVSHTSLVSVCALSLSMTFAACSNRAGSVGGDLLGEISGQSTRVDTLGVRAGRLRPFVDDISDEYHRRGE